MNFCPAVIPSFFLSSCKAEASACGSLSVKVALAALSTLKASILYVAAGLYRGFWTGVLIICGKDSLKWAPLTLQDDPDFLIRMAWISPKTVQKNLGTLASESDVVELMNRAPARKEHIWKAYRAGLQERLWQPSPLSSERRAIQLALCSKSPIPNREVTSWLLDRFRQSPSNQEEKIDRVDIFINLFQREDLTIFKREDFTILNGNEVVELINRLPDRKEFIWNQYIAARSERLLLQETLCCENLRFDSDLFKWLLARWKKLERTASIDLKSEKNFLVRMLTIAPDDLSEILGYFDQKTFGQLTPDEAVRLMNRFSARKEAIWELFWTEAQSQTRIRRTEGYYLQRALASDDPEPDQEIASWLQRRFAALPKGSQSSSSSWGEAQNMLYEATLQRRGIHTSQSKGSSLYIDPTKIIEAPHKTLLRIGNELKGGKELSSIRYIGGEDTADAGGPSRDYITRLFIALCAPDQKLLPMKETRTEEGCVFPLFDEKETHLSTQEQVQCYQAIGSIFAYAMRGWNSIRTGIFFSPLLFKLIHALKEEDFYHVSENWLKQPIFDDLGKDLQSKLLTIYLSDQFPYFQNKEILKKFLNEEEPYPMGEGEKPLSKDQFLSTHEVYGTVMAALIIARSMCEYNECVKARADIKTPWDRFKTSSAITLATNIQGTICTSETIEQALYWNYEWNETKQSKKSKEYFLQWNRKTSSEYRQFWLFMMTGCFTLPPKVLTMNRRPPSSERLPEYHSCTPQMDLPQYPDYETLKRKVEQSLDAALDGFQNY